MHAKFYRYFFSGERIQNFLQCLRRNIKFQNRQTYRERKQISGGQGGGGRKNQE